MFGKISKGQFVVLDTVVVLRLMAKPAVDGQHEQKTILGLRGSSLMLIFS